MAVGIGALFVLNGGLGLILQARFISKKNLPPQIDTSSIAKNAGFSPRSREQYLLLKKHAPFLLFVIRLQEVFYFGVIFAFAVLLTLRAVERVL